MTTQQFKDGKKDITRRFGWWTLKPGDRVRAVEKAMGLKKGEKMVSLGEIEIVSTRKEPLWVIDQDDCIREGFPHMSPDQFIRMLTEHYGCNPQETVNRIEFRRVS
jgi:hypothetical protein